MDTDSAKDYGESAAYAWGTLFHRIRSLQGLLGLSGERSAGKGVRAWVKLKLTSHFSSPCQVSMEIVSRFLEDEEFVSRFLQKSQKVLYESRLSARQLLTEAGFRYYDQG